MPLFTYHRITKVDADTASVFIVPGNQLAQEELAAIVGGYEIEVSPATAEQYIAFRSAGDMDPGYSSADLH